MLTARCSIRRAHHGAHAGDAVLAVVASGAHFVLATGRPPRWIPPVVEELGYAPMAVCANGAVIYDAASDRVVSARTLSVDVLAELAEIATRVVPGVGLAAERVGRSAHDSATRSSSARRVTNMPGLTRTTPKCRSKTR